MNIILATTSSFGKAAPESISLLEEKGFTVVTNPFGRKLTADELLALVQEHSPVGLLAGTEPVTRAVLTEASPKLQAVSRVGVGWDNVDHDAARELGIPVSRTEGILDQPVAELTMGMILDALRHVSRHDREIRSGKWAKQMGNLLAGKTVGIIGFGAIGKKVAKLLTAFDASPVFSDIETIEDQYATQVDLPELISQSDIITLHASGSSCILGEKELAATKDNVILINTARGGLIDESALIEALDKGAVGYACLDVFEKEPYQGKLVEMGNTILTAHIGSYAAEARVAMEQRAVENLLQALEA